MFKDGYYENGGGAGFTNSSSSSFGRWQPWNPTVEVVLQKIGIQVPMYVRHMRDIKVPAEAKPCGFDLIVGDWVAPYGKGVTADFVFQFDRAPERTITNRYGPSKLFDNKLTISFSNDGDGIQTAVAIPNSGLHLPRQAPLVGYYEF